MQRDLEQQYGVGNWYFVTTDPPPDKNTILLLMYCFETGHQHFRDECSGSIVKKWI